MDNNLNDNITNQNEPDCDSEYIGIDEGRSSLDLGGLFCSRFTNITRIYSSPNGPTEIYTATRYGKRYVLKGLKEQYRNDPIYTMALAKEFDIGISLEHSCVRRTIGLETVPETGVAIILEYVDGISLESVIASGRLTLSSARAIARQIADALDYIHTKQVFHRDLKPSNILVSHHGDAVKIIDFNLSDSDDFIVLKNPAGSKKYMAPEQLRPDAVPTAVADIYSFGTVMSELASATDDAKMAQTAALCMNSDPDKRPQSISQIDIPSSRPSTADKISAFLSSKILTYVMLCVCLSLAALIIYLLDTNS